MRYFEYQDDISNKFWQIHNYWNADKTYIEVRFGKIGSEGRTTKHVYYGIEAGDKLESNLISQKLKKGYVEKTPPGFFGFKTSKPVVKKSKASPKPKTIKKTCPQGKVLNPKTGRCINKPVVKKTNIKTKTKKPVKSKTKKPVKSKKCPPNKILNPKTGRCINKPVTKKTQPKKVIRPKKKPIFQTLKDMISPESKAPKILKPTGKALWDVKSQGIMLAHTYKDPKTGKVKNPPAGFPKAPVGWFLSEKFDGYRAIWDGQNFRSRTGNIFVAPQWFKSWLPNNAVLDGELFMGRECFEKCGIFRRKVPDEKQWRDNKVQYRIFDLPSMKAPFEERMKELEKIIKIQCKVNKGTCPLVMTKQIKLKSEKEMYNKFEALVKKGAEGVMIRSPGSPYDPKRSIHLLKVKQLYDDECRIIGYKKGTGKYENMLGAFECELVKNKNIKFTLSGMDDSIRQNYKKTHPIGTTITFTYIGTTEKGVPRHPNYLRIRKGKQ